MRTVGEVRVIRRGAREGQIIGQGCRIEPAGIGRRLDHHAGAEPLLQEVHVLPRAHRPRALARQQHALVRGPAQAMLVHEGIDHTHEVGVAAEIEPPRGSVRGSAVARPAVRRAVRHVHGRGLAEVGVRRAIVHEHGSLPLADLLWCLVRLQVLGAAELAVGSRCALHLVGAAAAALQEDGERLAAVGARAHVVARHGTVHAAPALRLRD